MMALPKPAQHADSEPVLLMSLTALGSVWELFDLPDEATLAPVLAAARRVWAARGLSYGEHSSELTDPFIGEVAGLLPDEAATRLEALLRSWTYRGEAFVPAALWVTYLEKLPAASHWQGKISQELITRIEEMQAGGRKARDRLGDVVLKDAAAKVVDDIELSLHAEHFIYFYQTSEYAPPPVIDTLLTALAHWWDAKKLGALVSQMTKAEAAWLYDDCLGTLRAQYEAKRERAESAGKPVTASDLSQVLPPPGEAVQWL